MKKFLKYCLLLFFSVIVNDISAQVKSGYIFGLNLSTVTIKSNFVSSRPETPFGIHYGGYLEIPVNDNLYFQPAVVFSVKGSNYKVDTMQYSISPIFVEVPLNLFFSFGSDACKIAMYGGPYFAFGLSGYKLEPDGTLKNLSYGSGEGKDLRTFDAGINLGAGLNIRGFLISAQYGIGLVNISPSSPFISEMKNRVIGISVSSPFLAR